jgi:hypothetical protein
MDIIDKKIASVKTAVENNENWNYLGDLDWSELSDNERKKFYEKFSANGTDTYTITEQDRDFTIRLINF